MCGRIIIYLTSDMRNVEDVGCIVFERLHSLVKYKFLSLTSPQDREKISKLVRKPITMLSVVKFDFQFPPVFTEDYPDQFYFIHHIVDFDAAQKGTSVVKISTRTLICAEIYQSKSRITHFSMKENDSNAQTYDDSISTISKLTQQSSFESDKIYAEDSHDDGDIIAKSPGIKSSIKSKIQNAIQ